MEAMIGALGIDRTVLDWFVARREPWLSTVLEPRPGTPRRWPRCG
jgi:hypothetical protein